MKEFSEIVIAEQASISAALERIIKKLPKAVQEIASYSLLSGGKRLRPILSLLCARLFSPEISTKNPSIYDAAIVLEMFHVASLLHDDVLDNADTRRGQISVHVKYGIRPCLLAGDALLAAGNRQMANFASELNCPKLIHSISDALLHTSTGEIEEIALVGKILPNMEEYFNVIEGKTAWMLRSACEVGAIMAVSSGGIDESHLENNTAIKNHDTRVNTCADARARKNPLDNPFLNEKIEKLATFGLNLGMAFQIVDDALDFMPESVTGKPIGGDLRERKCTPPILMYADSLNAKERKDFEVKFAVVPTPIFETHTNININVDANSNAETATSANINSQTTGFSESELADIIQKIIDNKYPEKTKALADSYLEKAEEALSSFSGKYSDILLQALQYVRARNK